MAASRFFGKPLAAHFIAQQRHTAGHAVTLAVAEHGDLQTDFAVAGGNGAGITMVAMHTQAALLAEGLVVIQGLLEGGLQLDRDLAFQVVLQSHSGASPMGRWGGHCTLILN